jgi:hypothetical protein
MYSLKVSYNIIKGGYIFMIKQEVVKAMSESKCIEKAKPIIERYDKEGYKLTDTQFSRSFASIKYILTFNK